MEIPKRKCDYTVNDLYLVRKYWITERVICLTWREDSADGVASKEHVDVMEIMFLIDGQCHISCDKHWHINTLNPAEWKLYIEYVKREHERVAFIEESTLEGP